MAGTVNPKQGRVTQLLFRGAPRGAENAPELVKRCECLRDLLGSVLMYSGVFRFVQKVKNWSKIVKRCLEDAFRTARTPPNSQPSNRKVVCGHGAGQILRHV